MSTHRESQPSRERSWIYITACVLLGGAALAAVLSFTETRESNRAQDKADELIAAFTEAGATRVPDKDMIVRLFGDDGGATCENPNDALNRATFLSLLTNGGTGPGARPVVADERVVQGQLLVMQVYCPDEVEDFESFVQDLKTGDVAGD